MDTDVKKDSVRASRRAECLDSVKNGRALDRQADERATTEEGIRVPPSDAPLIDLSRGFNPYDTGAFYKK
jgi:hypothetical protein